MGEDPVLAGTMVGNRIKCEQAEHVIADIKHYAMNDQESGRDEVNVLTGERAMRESDLLALQIGIGIGHPGAVMCSYNAVNGDYSCENKYLLTDVLKQDWNFEGFVLSDWGGTHSTVQASAAGLDNEEPMDDFFWPEAEGCGAGRERSPWPNSMTTYVASCARSLPAVSSMIPPQKSVVDVEAGFDTTRQIAEQSIVLLKNVTAFASP